MVIISEDGTVLGRSEGAGTNHWVRIFLSFVLCFLRLQLFTGEAC
jgi:hypothetical protein